MYMRQKPFKVIFVAAVVVMVFSIFSSPTHAQRRDFMTDAEIELVREHQEIDMRIDVLTKMIDRRLAGLRIESGGAKIAEKESAKWGPEPTGTRLELLFDIKRLLQKAIDDIDDIASHGKNALPENQMSGKLFPKAVRDLAKSAARYKPIFTVEITKTKDEKEKGVLLDSIESCDQIIEAVANLPAEVKDDKKKKN
jgi:hypothetical protein